MSFSDINKEIMNECLSQNDNASLHLKNWNLWHQKLEFSLLYDLHVAKPRDELQKINLNYAEKKNVHSSSTCLS